MTDGAIELKGGHKTSDPRLDRIPQFDERSRDYPSRLPEEPQDLPVVRLRNSWGDAWGVKGDCWIKVEDFEALLKADGDCCVPVVRKNAPAPQPDESLLKESGEARAEGPVVASSHQRQSPQTSRSRSLITMLPAMHSGVLHQ